MRFSSTTINQMPISERPTRFSVACNFDPALVDAISPYPTYEVFGKLPRDYFGGGRPSFYLPDIGKKTLTSYVKRVHKEGIEFNYLLNSSSMNNIEFTTEGQREMRKLLDWLSEIEVDTITVANLFFLRLIKQRYPHFGVRVSSHRETDNARKARFWEDNGADCIVISETTIHREFEVLRAIRESVKVDLSLIVNNWCRQDCAIASNHAVLLSNASRNDKQHFPLDYCSVYCNAYRLEEPVNYIRANWIRPEDIARYKELGFSNFKIVERNTPTELLALRVRAYHAGRYDGNLLDLVQNYAYPKSVFKKEDSAYYSVRRMARYFLKPSQVNLLEFPKIMRFGKTLSMLYPREGDNPVYIDNRALDGFLERFEKLGCESVDCEKCRYCHVWADKAVYFDPAWRQEMSETYDALLDDLHSGSLWRSYTRSAMALCFSALGVRNRAHENRMLGSGGAAVPQLAKRTLNGRSVSPGSPPCANAKPSRFVSVGNEGPAPSSLCKSSCGGCESTDSAKGVGR